MNNRPVDHSQEFRKILESAYKCCRQHQRESWILEPFENVEGNFRGVIYARSTTPIPGSAFTFSLEIDPTRLAEPPIIRFNEALKHPFVFPGNGMYCFPQDFINGISCRTPIDEILDLLVKSFFLQKPYFKSIKYNLNSKDMPYINVEAANLEYKNPELFWKQLRECGNLSLYSQDFFK